MCKLIDEFGATVSPVDKNRAVYTSLRTIIEAVDLIVGLFNSIMQNYKGEAKGCENIDRPSHPLLGKALKHLALFTEWKDESTSANHFFPATTYEDLVFMIFGLVGVSKTYLREDKSFVLVQRRGSTDNIEHIFCYFRMKSPVFTVADATRMASNAAGKRLNAGFLGRKTNNPGEKQTHKLADINRPLFSNVAKNK